MDVTDFDHFLLTRFNVRIGKRADDSWLRHRLGYFERLCRQSVLRQTTQNFRWLAYFDAERESWFEREVERLADGVFEPIWVAGELTPDLSAASVAERSSAPWVITTRVDNDDALARDFIEQVQLQFRHQETAEFINFSDGLQLSDGGKVFRRSDPSNAFISLIEKRTKKCPIGVYIDRHDRVSKHAPMRQVSTHPMWLQMVHGQNIGNTIRGVRAAPTILAQYFEVDAVAAPIMRFQLLGCQMVDIVSLGLRVIRKPHRILWLFRVLRTRLTGGSR